MTSTLSPSVHPRPIATYGLIDRLARRLVMQRLRLLERDVVTIDDDMGVTRFGSTGDFEATVRVMDGRFYRMAARGGSLGVAEAFLRGYWDSDDLTTLLRIFVRNIESMDQLERGTACLSVPLQRVLHWLRRNTRRGSRRNIGAHYDVGNEFFSLFLDESLTYSCAVFEPEAMTLHEASINKLDRMCRMLELDASHHLLEIGTGWGSFALHAAGRYGCRVTTITVSREQHALAEQRIAEAGLADRVDVVLTDYRDVEGRFDRIASIEMIEAVGHEHLPTFFRTCDRLLKPGGLVALQAITMPDDRYDQYRRHPEFIQQFVFPGSCVPSMRAMSEAMTRSSDLRLDILSEIGPHYATTLRCWRERFLRRLDEVRALGHSEGFIRLWEYYLCYCEAGFAERYTGAVQMTLRRVREPSGS